MDDLLCVGAVDNIILSSTIGRNKNLIPGEVISSIINGTEEFLNELKQNGRKDVAKSTPAYMGVQFGAYNPFSFGF